MRRTPPQLSNEQISEILETAKTPTIPVVSRGQKTAKQIADEQFRQAIKNFRVTRFVGGKVHEPGAASNAVRTVPAGALLRRTSSSAGGEVDSLLPPPGFERTASVSHPPPGFERVTSAPPVLALREPGVSYEDFLVALDNPAADNSDVQLAVELVTTTVGTAVDSLAKPARLAELSADGVNPPPPGDRHIASP